MFASFFPRPKLFFWSALLWTLAAVLFCFSDGAALGAEFGLGPAAAGAPQVVGASVFWSKPFLWFYIYYMLAVVIFGGFWLLYSPHPWARWSIFGSALIIFATYFQVEVSVAINTWYGPSYDLVQKALSRPFLITAPQFYSMLATFAGMALGPRNAASALVPSRGMVATKHLSDGDAPLLTEPFGYLSPPTNAALVGSTPTPAQIRVQQGDHCGAGALRNTNRVNRSRGSPAAPRWRAPWRARLRQSPRRRGRTRAARCGRARVVW